MPKVCEICGKGPASGRKYKRRGAIKRTGGAGAKIVGKTLRRFLPNLQRVRATFNGANKKIEVCAKCLKAGKITKASIS
jgi:large subunit ribosomal protein L28